jgi:hypothetical protein
MSAEITPRRKAPAMAKATPVMATSNPAHNTFCAMSPAPRAASAEASTAADEEVAVTMA